MNLLIYTFMSGLMLAMYVDFRVRVRVRVRICLDLEHMLQQKAVLIMPYFVLDGFRIYY